MKLEYLILIAGVIIIIVLSYLVGTQFQRTKQLKGDEIQYKYLGASISEISYNELEYGKRYRMSGKEIVNRNGDIEFTVGQVKFYQIGCVAIVNQREDPVPEFHIFNKALSKEEIERLAKK